MSVIQSKRGLGGNVLDSKLIHELNVVPSHMEGGLLSVFCDEHRGTILQQRLEWLTGCQVKLIPTSKDDLKAKIEHFEQGLNRLENIEKDFGLELVVDDGEQEHLEGIVSDDESEGPIVTLINDIIISSLKKNVSDIHLECYEKRVSVKYRIDGVLYPATVDLAREHHSSLVARLKVMAELDISERRVPQDGRFKLKFGKRYVDFRISVIPGLYGENVVIRILENKIDSLNDQAGLQLDSMGFSDIQLQRFKYAIHQPHGMILVAGPTGSGKTTTLYSSLQSLNDGKNKIITIEDPVEYQLEGVMQIPVNLKKGLTFSKGLRAILRHDPDKILVGEIRDLETAEIAMQSSLTGHLVFSTVHANSSFDVLARLENIGLNMDTALTSINCIVSQRLLRLNCKYCSYTIATGSEDLNTGSDSERSASKSGCEKCNFTGYSGRRMISEILEINDEIRSLYAKSKNVSDLRRALPLVGDMNLRASAMVLVAEGRVSLEEVGRVTYD